MKRVWRFLLTYKWFSLAAAALVAGLVLQLLGLRLEAEWVLGLVALVEVVPLAVDMWHDVRHGSYGIDILAATAIIVSVILAQDWAAIVVAIMLTGGESLEDYAERRAHSELDALLKRAPQMAHVVSKGKEVEVRASAVRAGDKVVVKPGELVPVDAVITDGVSDFDEASLTGESLPQPKKSGDQILSGSIAIDGAVTAKALRSAADSQYQQIVKLVRGAAAAQAPFVRLADRYSIPFSVAAYLIAAGAWVVGGHAIRFLEVIVVATPCPLLLAAPIALISGMARASKYGIIVKTGSSLEKLAEAQTVAFDKTGTLTVGRLSVDRITAFAPASKADVLAQAASLEQASNHVLARVIVEAAKAEGVKAAKAKQVQEEAGQGLRATIKGQEVLVGRLSLLEKSGVSLPAMLKRTPVKQTIVYVARGGKLIGLISLKDSVREDAQATLDRLRALGVRETLLITGDNAASGRAVAKSLGIKTMYAETLPGEKLQILEGLKRRPVVFVGDGVNDAPSLTAADVGIALGARGSTAASESADLVIMTDQIGHVAIAKAIAGRTFKIAKQSILAGIGLSLVLMAVFATGKFPPLLGAILQEVVDVVVIFNALRAHSGQILPAA